MSSLRTLIVFAALLLAAPSLHDAFNGQQSYDYTPGLPASANAGPARPVTRRRAI